MRPILATVATLGISILGQMVGAEGAVDTHFSDGQPTVVVAHRSAEMGGYPENTLAWLKYAIERGVDAVHVNPQKTRDGHYVLMHDPTLNRMTNVEAVFPDGPTGGPTRSQQGGRDYVGYYTLEDIKRLRVIENDRVTDLEVPTLQEAMEFVDGRIIVVLGLKSYDTPTLSTALQGGDLQNVVLFDLYTSGTDQSTLRELAEATGLDVHVVLYRSNDYLADLQGAVDELGTSLKGVHVSSGGLTPEFIAKLDELGVRLFISGWATKEDYELVENNNPEPWKNAFEVGTGVLTDRPDAVLELLGR